MQTDDTITRLFPVSRERYAHRSWRRDHAYHYAAKHTLIPLIANEVARAVLAMPVGFVAQKGRYQAVALLGFAHEQNLFVGPDGRWLGDYVPASLRGYPFQLAQAENKQWVLCFDESSGLLRDDLDEAPFFDHNGEPSELVRQMTDFHQQVMLQRARNEAVCEQLAHHQLLTRWSFEIKHADQAHRPEGLFKIDERQLNSLSGDALRLLRDSGALSLAYCQLLSMQNLSMLAKLADRNLTAQLKIDGFWSEDHSLVFDWD